MSEDEVVLTHTIAREFYPLTSLEAARDDGGGSAYDITTEITVETGKFYLLMAEADAAISHFLAQNPPMQPDSRAERRELARLAAEHGRAMGTEPFAHPLDSFAPGHLFRSFAEAPVRMSGPGGRDGGSILSWVRRAGQALDGTYRIEGGEDGLKDHIKTIGLFNSKAKNVIAMARLLVDEHGGEVPRTREELATPIAGVLTACADGAVAIDRPEGSRESMRASVREEMRR